MLSDRRTLSLLSYPFRCTPPPISGVPVTFNMVGTQACNPTDLVEIWRYPDESTDGGPLDNDGGSFQQSTDCPATTATGCCWSVYSPVTSSFLAFAGAPTTTAVGLSPSPNPSASPSGQAAGTGRLGGGSGKY